MTTIGVFLGSVRSGRIGEHIGAWVMDAAAERDAEYRLLDLADFDVPHLVAEVVPGAANKQYDDPAVTAWSEAVDGSAHRLSPTADTTPLVTCLTSQPHPVPTYLKPPAPPPRR